MSDGTHHNDVEHCTKGPDGQHCECWYDCDPCHHCGTNEGGEYDCDCERHTAGRSAMQRVRVPALRTLHPDFHGRLGCTDGNVLALDMPANGRSAWALTAEGARRLGTHPKDLILGREELEDI